MYRLQTRVRDNLPRVVFTNHFVNLFRFDACSSRGFFRRSRSLSCVLLPGTHRNYGKQNRVGRGRSTETLGSSSPSLSSFSTRVRELLLKFPKVPKVENYSNALPNHAGEERREMLIREQQASEEDLLMWLAATPSTSPASALHPLLCLRVLERLGYAVYRRPDALEGDSFNFSDSTAPSLATTSLGRTSQYSNPFLFSGDALRFEGWLSRHAHLSLATSPLQLRNIAENVLGPLESLMGDSSKKLKPHPQVAPVIHIALEWWCTLPCSSRLPADSWMPQLANFYSFSTAKLRQSDEGQPYKSHMDTRSPPIAFLLPYFIEKVRSINPHEVCSSYNSRSGGDDASIIEGNGRVSSTKQVHRALVHLFAFFLIASSSANLEGVVDEHSAQGDNMMVNRNEVRVLTTRSQKHQSISPTQEAFLLTCTTTQDGREFTLPVITLRDSLLANVLFWQGTSPLLALPLVARSLCTAAVLLFSFNGSRPSGVEVLTSDTVSVEEKCELSRGKRENEAVNEQDLFPESFTSSKQHICNCSMTLQISIPDDDTFRKLLLRLSSAIAEPAVFDSTTLRAREDPCGDEFEAYKIVSLIEPIVSFGHQVSDPQLTRSTVRVSSNLAHEIYDQDPVRFTTDKSCTNNRTAKSDISTPLRLINPLHDYLFGTYAEQAPFSTSCLDAAGPSSDTHKLERALRLSFVGVVNVLTAVLEHFERSRKESCCAAAAYRMLNSRYGGNASYADTQSDNKAQLRYTEFGQITSDSFTLLREKQRVHALKEICELLLNHARTSLHQQQPPRRYASECSEAPGIKHSNEGKQGCIERWFPDVSVVQQEAILRRMCGACRALVRVVMEEKRCSLILEGPEGAVVNAGGASYSLPSEDDNSTRMLSSGDSLQQNRKVFAEVLRNTAFRILEPSLWRYYTNCNEFEPQHLSFPTLQAICQGWASTSQTLRKTMSARLAKTVISSTLNSFSPATRAADLAYFSTIVNIDESRESELISFCESMESVYSNIGGAASWKTATHILQNPLQHPLHAVVEGIRLVCLHILLFANCGGTDRIHFEDSGSMSAPGAGNACHDESAKEPRSGGFGDKHVLLSVVEAFFCVWKDCGGETKGENLILADAALRTPIAVVDSVSRLSDAAPGSMLARLLLLVYLTLQRYFLHNRDESRAYCQHSDFNHDPIHMAFRSLRALFLLQDSGASLGRVVTSFDVVKLDRGRGDTCDAGAAPDLLRARFHCAVHDLNSEKLTRWELAERLRELVAATHTPRTLASVATWHWVGTPAAVRRAMRALKELSTLPEEAKETYYFLLPWSTLALSQHPLRLYDESGQSVRAAELFEQELQSFLESPSSALDHDIARGEALPGVRVVMRFVSAMEEIQHFGLFSEKGKCTQAVMFLADDIQVVSAETALEEGMRAWQKGPTEERGGVNSVGAKDEEGEYDGLD